MDQCQPYATTKKGKKNTKQKKKKYIYIYIYITSGDVFHSFSMSGPSPMLASQSDDSNKSVDPLLNQPFQPASNTCNRCFLYIRTRSHSLHPGVTQTQAHDILLVSKSSGCFLRFFLAPKMIVVYRIVCCHCFLVYRNFTGQSLTPTSDLGLSFPHCSWDPSQRFLGEFLHTQQLSFVCASKKWVCVAAIAARCI